MKNEEVIKDMIVKAHRNGKCDGNGESVKRDGVMIAKPMTFNSTSKRAVYENGKLARWI